MSSIRKQATDKHVTDALNAIQKTLDEILRRINSGEVKFSKKD